jgi:hypothetical protein
MMLSMPISNSIEDMVNFDNHDPALTLPSLVRHIGGGIHLTVTDQGNALELSSYGCIGGIFQRAGDAVNIPLTEWTDFKREMMTIAGRIGLGQSAADRSHRGKHWITFWGHGGSSNPCQTGDLPPSS